MASNLYDNYTLGRVRLMQEVLATLEMHERDRIAVIRVTQKMLERTFTTMEDTEYFINFPRAVRSVRVAVFLKEVPRIRSPSACGPRGSATFRWSPPDSAAAVTATPAASASGG